MANPGQLRLQNNRLFVVLSHWMDGDEEGTHWLCAFIGQDSNPHIETEIKLSNGLVCQGWNYMTLTDSGIEEHSTLHAVIEESDRKAICEVIFSQIGSDIRSPKTKEMLGPAEPDMAVLDFLDYQHKDKSMFQEIELSDKFWQDFWGVVPANRHRKHHHRELPRTKKHIKHRRWEDADWDGQR